MRKRNQPGIAANRRHPFLTSLIEQREMWLLCVPIIAWVLLFCYYPMYGVVIGFKDYYAKLGILGSPWAEQNGLEHFIRLCGA